MKISLEKSQVTYYDRGWSIALATDMTVVVYEIIANFVCLWMQILLLNHYFKLLRENKMKTVKIVTFQEPKIGGVLIQLSKYCEDPKLNK